MRLRRKKHPLPTTLREQIFLFLIALVVLVALYVIVFPLIYSRMYPLSATAVLRKGSLLYTLDMSQTHYRAGEPVLLRLGVKNTGRKPVELRFTTDRCADFLVCRDVNLYFFHYYPHVWSHLPTDAVHRVESRLTLSPGQKKTFEAVWSQKDYAGRAVAPGRYLITGILNTAGAKTELKLRGTTGKQ